MSETTAPYGTGAGGDAVGRVKRVRTHHLREMKERGEKFAMLTAYEQYAAQTFDEAGIPCCSWATRRATTSSPTRPRCR